MKLLILFPIVGVEKNIADILKDVRSTIAEKLEILGMTNLQIKFPGMDYISVKTNQVIEGQPKGKGIIEALENPSLIPDYVISCDGSCAIPLKYIVELFQELTSDSNIKCVMANRGENKGISDERHIIERFEIFILRRHFKSEIDIPDGQCGLWGFQFGKIYCNSGQKEIKLTANGYEIELDLLSELMRNELLFSFIDVDLPPREAPSSFTYGRNVEKMNFLVNKLDGLKNKLPLLFSEFEKTTDANEKLKNPEVKKVWESYKKDLLEI